MPLLAPATALSAAFLYALFAAFGEALFQERDRAAPPVPDERRPARLAPGLLASFAAGFGLSGVFLHGMDTVSPAAQAALAVATGAVLAGLVASIVRLLGTTGD